VNPVPPMPSPEYTAEIRKEGDQFIAHAVPLDVMSSGLTPEEAKEALDEALHLFLRTAMEMGTLDEILQEAGYEFRDGIWVEPALVTVERRSTAVGA